MKKRTLIISLIAALIVIAATGTYIYNKNKGISPYQVGVIMAPEYQADKKGEYNYDKHETTYQINRIACKVQARYLEDTNTLKSITLSSKNQNDVIGNTCLESLGNLSRDNDIVPHDVGKKMMEDLTDQLATILSTKDSSQVKIEKDPVLDKEVFVFVDKDYSHDGKSYNIRVTRDKNIETGFASSLTYTIARI